MKMNLYSIWAVAVVATLALSSCSSTYTTLSRNAKELSTEGAIRQTDVTMDVEVGEKVSYERVFKYGKGNLTRMSRKESKEIEIATAELLSKFGGDVLVERRYTVSTVSASKKITSTVKVEGYLAKYKNFRTTQSVGDTKKE